LDPDEKFGNLPDVLAVSAAGIEAAELALSPPFKLRIPRLGCKHLRITAVLPLQSSKP
jgi:hypothetical protein